MAVSNDAYGFLLALTRRFIADVGQLQSAWDEGGT